MGHQNHETLQAKRWSWLQRKPKTFKTDSAGNIQYDSSLLKALHRTFFIRWWASGFLLLIAGRFPSWKNITLIINYSDARLLHRHTTNHNSARQQSYPNVARGGICIPPPHGRAESIRNYPATSGRWIRYRAGVCIVYYARSATAIHFMIIYGVLMDVGTEETSSLVCHKASIFVSLVESFDNMAKMMNHYMMSKCYYR